LSVVTGLPAALEKKYALADDAFGNANNEGRTQTRNSRTLSRQRLHPNAKGDLSRLRQRCELWDPAFLAYLKKLNKLKPVIVCGDLNVARTPTTSPTPSQCRQGRLHQ